MDASLKLNENEKIAILGLCQLIGTNSDSEIADIVDIKRSTFSIIKQRLQSQELYTHYYFPNFHALGAQLMTYSFTQTDVRMLCAGRSIEAQLALAKFPTIISNHSESNQCVINYVSRDYNDFFKSYVYAEQILKPSQSSNNYHFPLETTTFHRIENFSLCLSKIWGNDLLENENVPFKLPINDQIGSFFDYTNRAWMILESFIKNPELTTQERSNALEMHENTIRKYKKQFQDNNILHPVLKMNLKKFGLNIKLIGVIKVLTLDEITIQEVIDLIKDIITPTTLISCYNQILFESYFQDYQKLRIAEDEMIQRVNESQIEFSYRDRMHLSAAGWQPIITPLKSFAENIKYLRKKVPL